MSLGKVMMKHSSPQFVTNFQDLITKEKKFCHIGTCIRHNFMPCKWLKKKMADSTEVFYKINMIKH